MNNDKELKNRKTPKTLSLSVPKGYENEVSYVNQQPNKSRYIWDLVRQDMKQQSEDSQIIEVVRQAMQSLTLNNITLKTNDSPVKNINKSDELKRKKGALSILQE